MMRGKNIGDKNTVDMSLKMSGNIQNRSAKDCSESIHFFTQFIICAISREASK